MRFSCFSSTTEIGSLVIFHSLPVSLYHHIRKERICTCGTILLLPFWYSFPKFSNNNDTSDVQNVFNSCSYQHCANNFSQDPQPEFGSVQSTILMWKSAERHQFPGCFRWCVCWIFAGGDSVYKISSVNLPSSSRSISLLRTIGTFWELLGVSFQFTAAQTISNHFCNNWLDLLITLTKRLLLPFFSISFCCLSR